MKLAEYLALPLTDADWEVEAQAWEKKIKQYSKYAEDTKNMEKEYWLKVSIIFLGDRIGVTVGDAIEASLELRDAAPFQGHFSSLGGLPFEVLETGNRLADGDHDNARWLFKLDGKYFAGYGYYTSEGGSEYDDSLEDFKEVKPVVRTYTDYESI